MSFDLFMQQARDDVPFKQIELAGGQSGGHFIPPEGPVRKNIVKQRKQQGCAYAHNYRLEDDREEDGEEGEGALFFAPRHVGKGMSEVEELTSMGTHDPELVVNDYLNVYDEYTFDHKTNPDLLIHQYKDPILAQVSVNNVVIIKGPTGCGKSTQVPQYILDDARDSQIYCNVVITQPRKIAATSVAKRVCEERGWRLGSLVGFQVGLEKSASKDTRLLYCTAGVLLQQLIGQQTLSTYTHIIIDEVHERDSETDFLLIVIKKLMKMRGNRTKLILMSATVNTEKFISYFTRHVNSQMIRPPVIELPHKLKYDVQEYYLDCLVNKIYFMPCDVDLSEPKIAPPMFNMASLLVEVFAAIDGKDHKHNPSFLGAVLIFLPGIHEIDVMFKKLKMKDSIRPAQGERWHILPLHSTLSFEEQKKVFLPPPVNHRKIILTTNIAESSITVPDVKYVIDFCLTKQQVQDPSTFYSSLQLCWVSKSQAMQRAGRVGRTMPGRVYRLVPKDMYMDFEDDCTAEMLRCPLDQLVLKSKELNMGPPVAILGCAIDTPDLTNIQRTILNLKEMGALTLTVDDKYSVNDGNMTFTGRVMAALPLDTQLSKLILIGHMLRVLRDCVIMACCMTGKHIFTTPIGKHLEAFNNKLAWADQSASDSLTCLAAYKVWKLRKGRGIFSRSGCESEKDWARRNFVDLKSLKEVERLENEIITRLDRLGISEPESQSVEEKETSPLLLKIAIAGAFYPNYFLHCPVDESEAVKTIGGRDPFRTVYLTKFPQNQPGPLYRDSIKSLLSSCGSNMKVQFDGSSKVYVEFGSSSEQNDNMEFSDMAIPGRVMKAVYRALKLKQLRIPMTVPLLSVAEAQKRAKEIFGDKLNTQVMCWQKNTAPPKPKDTILPSVSISHISIVITHIIDPHNFYVSILDGPYNTKNVWLHKEINARDEGVQDFIDPKDIKAGMMCLAPYSSKGETPAYFRCKILQVIEEIRVKVLFIDYGNVEMIEKSLIRGYGRLLVEKKIPNEPALCIHCRLAEVQPLAYKDKKSGWCSQAISSFKKSLLHHKANAKIYSVVDDIMALYLFPRTGMRLNGHKLAMDESFNSLLVKQNFAHFLDEPYLSKKNHDLREKVMANPGHAYTSSVDAQNSFLDELEFKSPTIEEAKFSVTLLGPKSPLEMTVTPISRKCIGKTASIESSSVNSVLIDNHPMDPTSRLLVAGSVTQNMSGDKLTLRNTTMLPSIQGIVGMMCLIFAPSIELRTDPTRSFFTGALCGLGCNEEGESYDCENDVEVTFDCQFDLDDIEMMNKIRYWINQIMCGTSLEKEDHALSRPRTYNAQTNIVKYLHELFSKDRDRLCAHYFDNAYEWNQIPEEFLLNPSEESHTLVYPLIWGVDLNETSMELKNERMLRQIELFDCYVNKSESMKSHVTCELCQVYLETLQALSLHIKTAIHNNRLARLRKELKRNVPEEVVDSYLRYREC